MCPPLGVPLLTHLPFNFGLSFVGRSDREGTEGGSPAHTAVCGTRLYQAHVVAEWPLLMENVQSRLKRHIVHRQWSTHRDSHLEEPQLWHEVYISYLSMTYDLMNTLYTLLKIRC